MPELRTSPIPDSLKLRVITLAVALAVSMLAFGALRAQSALAACTSNAIVCENQLPGDAPSDWQINGAGDSTIQGFATSMSVNAGQTESFKIKTPSTKYHIDILRLGYYGGDGARKIVSSMLPTATLPQTQPACNTDATTGLIDCGNWSVSASWTVPSTAVSGVYIAHLVRDDSQDPGGDSQIMFVVRNDASHSGALVATSDATWEAYNDYGGNSLYSCTVACPSGNPLAYKAAYAVSYNRPNDGALNTDGGASNFYYAEYQMVRWMEENGYDVSYTSDSQLDSASGAALIANHKLFISSGHDEYWSAGEYQNLKAALTSGVNEAYFSGNEMFWKTRWANDASGTPYRTLISYKETHFNAPTDPQDPGTWTGAWGDPRFSPPADGGIPANALTGQEFVVNQGTADITVPYQYHSLRFWRNTGVAKLTSGQTLTLAPGTGTLGYEWDVEPDNGFQPPGEFQLSSTTVSGLQTFTDYGSTVIGPGAGGGTETHHLTLYKAPSGALVFGAGTVQWSWGLDNTNAWENFITDPSGNPPDKNIEQATVNLFADMGVQPASLISGLTAGTASTDTTPPHSTITSPTNGSTAQDGNTVTISGSATDSGGGVVAGVEVSVDGGHTWHFANMAGPAATTVNWTYSWIAANAPSTTIMSRATDDSGNIETPSPGVTINVGCPCSVFGNETPPTADDGDPSSVEVGMKFQSSTFGTVTGIRFYKAAGNTGSHIGSLWTASGQLLTQVTFTNETASGWQNATFASPVTIMPNTTYVVGYLAPNGHYSGDSGWFYPAPSPPPTGGGNYNSPPLSAVPNNTSANGLFDYTSSSVFPTSTFDASNYWVDVDFVATPAPGQVTNVSATAGFNSANVSWTAPSTGGSPTSYIVTPYIGSTAQTPTTVTGTPPVTNATISNLAQGTAYTFKVQAVNPAGNGTVSAASNSVTPSGPQAPAAPTNVSANPASGQALVSWTAPNSNGSGLTGYIITPFIGSTAQTSVPVLSGTATSAPVTGLNVGTSYTFTVTATNNIGTGPASAPSSAVTPADTIFDFGTPQTIDSGDTAGVEVGVKFTADSSGQITGLRFYKASTNVGTHIGSLWTSTGTLLASATFTNESASGWQYVTFASPVAVSAGTTYVAGYLAPQGHYSFNSFQFNQSVGNPPLHALANATSVNGLYAYSGVSTFPTSSFNASNYWVDVLFAPTAPGQVTNVTATAGHGAATVSWTAPSGGGATSYIVTPFIGSTAQTATTVTGAPPATTATINNLTAGTAYTFTVQAVNNNGNGPASAQSNSVTPTGAIAPSAPTAVTASPATGQAQVSWTTPNANGNPITGYTVTPFIGTTAQTPVPVSNGSATSATVTGLTTGTAYTFTVSATNSVGTSAASTASSAVTPQDTIFDFAAPAVADAGDPSSLEVGVKFTASVSGQVTGVRFYKAAANTGAHIGSLWSSTGTLLSSATFTNETASGWQFVTFPSPVSVTAGTTYVAGYFDPSGHYSATSSGFSSAFTNSPLTALANATSANGVYAYSSTSTFPSSSFSASNYWVDVLFTPQPPGQVTNVIATAGNASATVSWTAPSGGGATSYIVTPFIGSTAQTPVTINGTPPATNTTITGLTSGTAYTFTVQAANANGNGPVSAHSNSVTPTGAIAPSAPTAVTASPATGQAQVSWTTPNNGGSPITSYTVTPFIGTTAQTPVPVSNGSATSATVTGLTTGTAYTFTVSATNSIGTSAASTASSAATPENTIFDFTAPASPDSGDGTPVEVGVKFLSSSAGSVTGIRFYKSAANTGAHIVNLWSLTGTLLATANVSNETTSGWQYATFSSPVSILANTTYVASYFAPNGHYSATSSAFTSAFSNPPLQAVSNSLSANGVFAVSSTSTFPLNSFNSTNYWVDVLFAAGS
jgi:Domain of unknown function (DUF4082)/Fibronectin type III domain/Bacterial Ig domain